MENKITKRQFLKTTMAATAAVMTWEPLVFAGATAGALRRLNLGGLWRVSQKGKNDWISAGVPGCVHTDLLAAGKIPDPFYRDNEKRVQWITEADWVYERSFDVPDDVLKNDFILLRCEGLDTVATIEINGTEVGRANNMFRVWEFDVRNVLHAGNNTIRVTFGSPLTYIKQHEDSAPNHWVTGRAWVRKEPCSFDWDWGPDLASCGIWRAITLETFNQARIANVLVVQNLAGNRATLDVSIDADAPGQTPGALRAAVTVLLRGDIVAKTTVPLSNGSGSGQLEIRHPKLWWPAGMGDQPLYDVQVELMDEAGATIDNAAKRIGLRELKMILPEGSSPLQFEVNGVPFFCKGANWIPCDSFTSRVTPEILRGYVADAAAVNVNMLRFWGGGYYEDDALFDACDEMGICVWLDCKFACAAYPAFDDRFMDNVRQEISDNVRRLRHHPCIAVWCGNNEISFLRTKGPVWGPNRMSDTAYDDMFKKLIAGQVQQLAPQANYVSGSPDCGDTHYWEVWHGPKMFDAYRTVTGFMSEFGFQSFPQPKTVRAFTSEEDRASVVTPVMNWHQRDGSGRGNEIIRDMTLRYFRPPKDFDTALWLSQILQGYGIKIGAEYWRQTMPVSMGCVFWQYNDIWPGMSWSSVDYFGRWKALHYLARKFYSPILVSGRENRETGTLDLFVTSDLLEAKHGKLHWKATDLTGEVLARDSFHVEIPSRKSMNVKTLNFQDLINKSGANGFLTWLDLEVGGKIISENLVLFALPKEYELANPALDARVDETGDGYQVTITAQNPALWVWADLENADAKYSENFFHLGPSAPRKILIQPKSPLAKDNFINQLRVRSLFDTYAVT